MFTDHTRAIEVWTDGSYHCPTGRQAYGWVCGEVVGSSPQARVVNEGTDRTGSGQSNLMESRAIVDAVCEFAQRDRKIIVWSDTQSLPGYVSRYRASGDSALLLSSPTVIGEPDARRLMNTLSHCEVEFRWVKGHSDSFENHVIDQALRMVTIEGETETEATAWSVSALKRGEAVVWGKQATGPKSSRTYFNGYFRVADSTRHFLACS